MKIHNWFDKIPDWCHILVMLFLFISWIFILFIIPAVRQ